MMIRVLKLLILLLMVTNAYAQNICFRLYDFGVKDVDFKSCQEKFKLQTQTTHSSHSKLSKLDKRKRELTKFELKLKSAKFDQPSTWPFSKCKKVNNESKRKKCFQKFVKKNLSFIRRSKRKIQKKVRRLMKEVAQIVADDTVQTVNAQMSPECRSLNCVAIARRKEQQRSKSNNTADLLYQLLSNMKNFDEARNNELFETLKNEAVNACSAQAEGIFDDPVQCAFYMDTVRKSLKEKEKYFLDTDIEQGIKQPLLTPTMAYKTLTEDSLKTCGFKVTLQSRAALNLFEESLKNSDLSDEEKRKLKVKFYEKILNTEFFSDSNQDADLYCQELLTDGLGGLEINFDTDLGNTFLINCSRETDKVEFHKVANKENVARAISEISSKYDQAGCSDVSAQDNSKVKGKFCKLKDELLNNTTVFSQNNSKILAKRALSFCDKIEILNVSTDDKTDYYDETRLACDKFKNPDGTTVEAPVVKMTWADPERKAKSKAKPKRKLRSKRRTKAEREKAAEKAAETPDQQTSSGQEASQNRTQSAMLKTQSQARPKPQASAKQSRVKVATSKPKPKPKPKAKAKARAKSGFPKDLPGTCNKDKIFGLLKNPRRLEPRFESAASNIRDLYSSFSFGLVISKDENSLNNFSEYGYQYRAKVKGSKLCRKWTQCSIPKGEQNKTYHVLYGVEKDCAKSLCETYLEKYYENDREMFLEDEPPGVYRFCRDYIKRE